MRGKIIDNDCREKNERHDDRDWSEEGGSGRKKINRHMVGKERES